MIVPTLPPLTLLHSLSIHPPLSSSILLTDVMRNILTEADRLQEAMLSGGRGGRQPPGRRR
jgi:hypothetical protein